MARVRFSGRPEDSRPGRHSRRPHALILFRHCLIGRSTEARRRGSMKRIGMNDIKDILRQRHGLGLTRDRIAAATGVSAGTVSHVLERAAAAGWASDGCPTKDRRPSRPERHALQSSWRRTLCRSASSYQRTSRTGRKSSSTDRYSHYARSSPPAARTTVTIVWHREAEGLDPRAAGAVHPIGQCPPGCRRASGCGRDRRCVARRRTTAPCSGRRRSTSSRSGLWQG